MLAIYMFHYARNDGSPWATAPEQLTQNLLHLASLGETVHSGEYPLDLKPAICLSFDDASYCFYHYIYPILKEHSLKAILAVPTSFILDDCDLTPNERLNAKPEDLLNAQAAPNPAFCTWKELREMQRSGCVELASHTCSHINLNRSADQLSLECVQSAVVMEEKAGIRPVTLVLPFGRGNRHVVHTALQSYRYVLRIGNAWNHSWQDRSPLYRIPADRMTPNALPLPGKFCGWANHYWNRLRGR